MATLLSLQSQIAKLQAQADALRESEKAGVISRIRDAIDAYQISAEMLGFGASRRGAAGVKTKKAAAPTFGVPRFRDPKTGKTWTGRGKPPAWIAGVKDRDAFLIRDSDSAATPAGKATRGSRGKPKAPKVGAPKYRNPEDGKTWTGRGKPPAWIAGVENRDAFLIAK